MTLLENAILLQTINYRNIVRGKMKRFSLIVCNLRHVLKYKKRCVENYVLCLYRRRHGWKNRAGELFILYKT